MICSFTFRINLINEGKLILYARNVYVRLQIIFAFCVEIHYIQYTKMHGGYV